MEIPAGRNAAFSLVEVALALGVAAFCLVGIFGLLPIGLNSNQAAIQQTTAAGLASTIVADLRAPQKAGASPFYGIPIPTSGSQTSVVFLRDDGSPTGAQNTTANASLQPMYRATLVFTVPPAATAYYGTSAAVATQGKATVARVLITWPALADPDYTKAPTHSAGSFETITALDRN